MRTASKLKIFQWGGRMYANYNMRLLEINHTEQVFLFNRTVSNWYVSNDEAVASLLQTLKELKSDLSSPPASQVRQMAHLCSLSGSYSVLFGFWYICKLWRCWGRVFWVCFNILRKFVWFFSLEDRKVRNSCTRTIFIPTYLVYFLYVCLFL